MQTLRTLLDPENMGPQTSQGINVSGFKYILNSIQLIVNLITIDDNLK